MIEVATADLRVMLADHMAFLRSQVSPMSANNSEIERAISGLPERIAAHGPFRDVEHIRTVVRDEARDLFATMNLNAATIRTCGSA